MGMDELRWILLIVGLLILAGIYFFADPSQRPGGTFWVRSNDDDGDDVDQETESTDADTALDSEVPDEHMERELERLGELISEERQAGLASTEDESSGPALSSEPEKIVTLFLRPRGDGRIKGADIREAAENVALVFGDMQIFHRMQELQGSKTAIFSLADMMAPGAFEIDRINEMSTPGLCLFLTLPNHLTALDAWDAMQASGQRLAELLDTELLDDSQSSLSRQRIAHIREEMREYDRQAEGGRPVRIGANDD
jgi:cell division protein ZipA